MEHLGDMSDRLRRYAAADYDGIECAFIHMPPKKFSELTEELNLDYVAMMFCDDEQAFEKQLAVIRKARPVLINCHPGRDYFSVERSIEFFNNVTAMARDINVQVVFETHRTRCLYSPWQTAEILEALPDLRITADLSHFTCVAENGLEKSPYQEMVQVALERADHIHARVGSTQGAQVANPMSTEGMKWTEHFERWWDQIIEMRRDEGRSYLTINPEFGPPPYQPVGSDGESPTADIWEVCLWMKERFRSRWANGLA